MKNGKYYEKKGNVKMFNRKNFKIGKEISFWPKKELGDEVLSRNNFIAKKKWLEEVRQEKKTVRKGKFKNDIWRRLKGLLSPNTCSCHFM